MASPDARPAPDAVSDRAALLRYVLDHVLQRCSLPDGVSNVKDLNLAQIDVPSLLASLREPLGRPDLVHAAGAFPIGSDHRYVREILDRMLLLINPESIHHDDYAYGSFRFFFEKSDYF